MERKPAEDRVLVVDDQPATCLVLRHAVTAAGGMPITVQGLAQARELLALTDFACALIDKNLPDGSGLKLLAEIRRDAPDTDALIITGYANVESVVEALRLGARDYIVKPFDLDLITHRIRMLLERRRDAREKARLEETLVEAEQLASIGLLTAGVGHEMSNPLTYLAGNVELALRSAARLRVALNRGEAPPTEQLLELETILGDALQGTERLRSILQDLRRLSRKTEGDSVAAIDVRTAVNAAAKFAGGEVMARARLHLDLREVPLVRANEGRIGQVVLNLLLNAAQAISPGDPTSNDVWVTTCTDGGGRVVVEVKDSGEGMTEDTRASLFKPFFTTRPSGTGLGLSVCQRIVQRLKGTIEVESEKGRGSTFRVVLPAYQPVELPPVARVH